MSAAPLRFGHATESVDTVAPFVGTDGVHHLIHTFCVGSLPRLSASKDSVVHRDRVVVAELIGHESPVHVYRAGPHGHPE